jgi:hypothetical protein
MSWFRGLSLKPFTLLAIITFIVAVSFPVKGHANENKAINNIDNSSKISRAVDADIVSAQLKKLGLTDNDINERLDKLTDDELHQFASNPSDIYPGGSLVGAIVLTAIILVAAYAYIKHTGKRVIIE